MGQWHRTEGIAQSIFAVGNCIIVELFNRTLIVYNVALCTLQAEMCCHSGTKRAFKNKFQVFCVCSRIIFRPLCHTIRYFSPVYHKVKLWSSSVWGNNTLGTSL